MACALPPAALAQVSPAAVGAPMRLPGFELPRMGGSLQYAVSASQNITSGFYNDGGVAGSTNISGDLAYLSGSLTRPFSMVYSGAVLAGTGGEPSSVVENLALSQVLVLEKWQFTVSDAVSYLPESPSVGLSGVPGLGDTGVASPEVGPVAGQAVLTSQANRVTNSTAASASRQLTGRLAVVATGSYAILRFTGSSGSSGSIASGGLAGPAESGGLTDTDQAVGSLGPSYRLSARAQVSANYSYSHIGYPGGLGGAIEIQGFNGGYTRQWSRWFRTATSAGPQWVTIGGSAGQAAGQTSVNLAANAAGTVSARATAGSVSYVRGANSGFGVLQGSSADSIEGNVSHRFGRTWSAAATVNESRNSSLPGTATQAYRTDTMVSSLQASRSLSSSLSLYVSYNTLHQSTAGDLVNPGAFRGLSQIVGFGLTYAPRARMLGPQAR